MEIGIDPKQLLLQRSTSPTLDGGLEVGGVVEAFTVRTFFCASYVLSFFFSLKLQGNIYRVIIASWSPERFV